MNLDLKIDSLKMVEATVGLPEQMEKARGKVELLDKLPKHDDIENVVILGMGGSGICGDIVAQVGESLIPVPVHVVKGYEIPAFVGGSALVFSVSFSGNTEETLEATEEAYEDGAIIVPITTGGALKKLAEDWGIGVIDVDSSIPQPRAGVGAMTIPIIEVLEAVGLFPVGKIWIDKAISQLVKRRSELGSENDITSAMAKTINGHIPLIYSTNGIGSVAADRWKKQINENPKSPSFVGVYPELCHNELAGWGLLGDVTRQAFVLIQLIVDDLHPQLIRRIEWVRETLRESVNEIVEVMAQGEDDLAQLFDLMFIGDIVSLRLAGLNGVDPGPIPILNDMKNFLKNN